MVLLIDELETLSQNDKSGFGLIVEMLNLNFTGFAKICIANTLSLFTSVNGNKLNLNFRCLVFKPYSALELIGIITARIKDALQSYNI